MAQDGSGTAPAVRTDFLAARTPDDVSKRLTALEQTHDLERIEAHAKATTTIEAASRSLPWSSRPA